MDQNSQPTTVTRTYPHREGHTMDHRKQLLREVIGTLSIPGDIKPTWEEKGGFDEVPKYWGARIIGVDVCLRDGLTPPDAGRPIIGRIEVKRKVVTQHLQSGDENSQYLAINIFPLPEESTPTATVAIRRPSKINGTRCLPTDFDRATDYSVNRQGQPWQVITVRTANEVRFSVHKADAPSEEIDRSIAELSTGGPAVVAKVDPEAGGLVVVMDARGSAAIAQAIYAERGDDNFPPDGVIATWTPAATDTPAA